MPPVRMRVNAALAIRMVATIDARRSPEDRSRVATAHATSATLNTGIA